MNFKDLEEFVANKMRMSQIYQPVMLLTLLDPIGAESACAVPHKEAPTRGALRSLARVLRLRHPLGLIIMCGIRPSRTTSLRSSPQASARCTPVSLTIATIHLRSSSISTHKDWMFLIVGSEIGSLVFFKGSIGIYVLDKGLDADSPCS